MKILVKDYVIEGETSVNNDVLDFSYNARFGFDPEVLWMWIKDECMNVFGVDLTSFKFEMREV